MKRLLLAGLLAVIGASAAGVAVAAAPPRASLTGFQCQQASEPAGRGMQIIAVMRPVRGTKAMRLRFVLLAKPRGAAGYSVVPTGNTDLGRWIAPTSPPTLGQRPGDIWRLTKEVVDLSAPVAYRIRVEFRWLGSHSRVLGTTTRSSPVCVQTAPDLLVKSIAVAPVTNKPNLNRFIAVIGNDGNAGAGPFVVQFSDGTAATKTHTVSYLAPRDTVRESFVGPKCTTGAVTVTADPGDQTDDYNRSNNAMTAVC